MCQWIVDTLTAADEDGKCEEAFDANLGGSGAELPDFPEMDACS